MPRAQSIVQKSRTAINNTGNKGSVHNAHNLQSYVLYKVQLTSCIVRIPINMRRHKFNIFSCDFKKFFILDFIQRVRQFCSVNGFIILFIISLREIFNRY